MIDRELDDFTYWVEVMTKKSVHAALSLTLLLAWPAQSEASGAEANGANRQHADRSALPLQGPVPLVHPFAATMRTASPFQDVITTTAIPPPASPKDTSLVSPPPVSPRLKQALAAIDNKQFSAALALSAKMKLGSPERQLVHWLLVTSNAPDITSTHIRTLMSELQDWPDQTGMRQAFERTVARENQSPANVIALLGNQEPQTVAGRVALGNALARNGQIVEARTLLKSWWHKEKLRPAEEKFVLEKLENKILDREDHLHRMKRMLYDYRLDSTEHLSRLSEARSLYLAVAAVARQEKNAAQVLAKVDKSWVKDPLYHFARIQHLRRSGKYDEAAKLMLKIPAQAEALIHPDAWWVERRALSREMLDLGKYKLAYQIVAAQMKTSTGVSATATVDAQFHAGWYALRFLKDAKTAQKHFAGILEISNGSISQARGLYWLARAKEALNEPKATHDYYAQAARFPTTYYGQLAAAKLGQKNFDIPYFKPSIEERNRFANMPAVKAISLLQAVGDKLRAETLTHKIGQSLTRPGELALLTAMAEKQDNHYLSLRIGKQAHARGVDVGALTHPLGAINVNIPLTDKALAYAVARQESEFNPTAQSGAGARGLLQLMPKTAKAMAKAQKIAYSLEKLSNDASYNVILGSHFLVDQLARFDGSYVLTFIGYNAGSGRVRDWISRYGDPRRQNVDMVVDWVERIPFTETRNYVQRVMENYQIYQARLGGRADIARDLTR